MNPSDYAIQIIPDLSIDDKYAAIIGDAQNRISVFTGNALKGDRIGELFLLKRSKIDASTANKVLNAEGKLVVGFQFESRLDPLQENFHLYVRKMVDSGKSFKFYLTPTVQEIMLQLISLEDRRTVAVFSMLNSSMDVGHRILTTSYANQLKRLVERVAGFLRADVSQRAEKLAVSKSDADGDPWKEAEFSGPSRTAARETRAASQDNILQVMADDDTFAELNQYVENVVSRRDRIQKKRLMLETNPDLSRQEAYEQMVREDMSQLENCYARIHIYLKAFYKNRDRRSAGQNRVLRQFFAGEIEKILGETGLLEDLLSLNEDEYYKNIDRHKEL